MIKIEIDYIEFFVDSNVSILEACESLGIDVPRFCYHQSLSVAGNCRMCLIEILGSPKPIASCALSVSNNMKIFIESPLVKKARENVLEFLLINHPLDCPICDQGGECDLQDQVRIFGIDSSRFFFNKRTVEDKNCGPLIKTIMTRCIHCTRCVRFNSEISQEEFFGTLNRGVKTEIGPYLDNKSNFSFLSGNVIDLCPVGALTSKQYSFKTRPWELFTKETIDVTDGFGANIYVSTKESEILRIFPKLNRELNERFITNKTRFYFDSNKQNRVLQSNISTDKESKKFLNEKIKNFLSLTLKKKITLLINNSLDLDGIFLVKCLEKEKNKERAYARNIVKNNKTTNLYISWLNSHFNTINKSKICFIFSSDLKLESSILNLKIRLKETTSTYLLFGFNKSSSNIKTLNLNIFKFIEFFRAKDKKMSFLLIKHKNPLFVISNSFFRRGFNFESLYNAIKYVNPTSFILKISNVPNIEGNNFFNVKHISKRLIEKTDRMVCFNLDDSFFFKKYINSKKLLFFSTHNTDLFKLQDDIIIYPFHTEFEKNKIFLNFEQRIQSTSPVFSDQKKIIFYKNYFNIMTFIYSNHINFFKEMLKYKSLFAKNIDNLNFSKNILNIFIKKICSQEINNYPTKNLVEDFYLTNKMLKNSSTMQKVSQNYRKKDINFNS